MLAILHEQLADIVGPKMLSNEGTICSADPCFNADQLPESSGPGEQDVNQFDYTSDAKWLPTQFLLIRREVINAVGGFDEAYECSQIASADFCLKARLRDFKCLYTGSAAVVCNTHIHTINLSASLKRYNEKWSDYAHLFWDKKQAE
jgi:GT2 family glycosyltransferase